MFMKKPLLIVGGVLVLGYVLVTIGYNIRLSEENKNTGTVSAERSGTVYTDSELLDRVNALRVEKGVNPLVIDTGLTLSAQTKAEDMKTGNYYDHKNPLTGKMGYEYIIEKNPNACKYVSENLAGQINGTSPFAEKDGWQTSPKHYEAIIDPKYDVTGFGHVTFGGYDYYVEHFCDLN